MRTLRKTILALCLIVLFQACSSENDSSVEQPVLSVNFQTMTSSFSLTDSDGSFQFTEGFITLSAMEYEAESENDLQSVEFELEEVVIIDFATGIPDPDIRGITIPAGTYEEVSVELEILDEVDNPSVIISGTYTNPDNITYPIRFEFNSGETFEVEREGTIIFNENQSALAQITFDPSLWFEGVTDELMADATLFNGVIIISETQNSAIFDIVADGLDLATELEIEN